MLSFKNKNTKDSLLKAARENDVKRFIELLDKRSLSKEELQKYWGINGNTPLHQAVIENNCVAVEILLAKHFEVTKENSQGYCPIHLAALFGHAEVAEAVIKDDPLQVSVKTRDGNSALHICIQSRKYKMIKLLTKYDIDTSIQNSTGKTALDMAAEAGDKFAVEALLSSLQEDVLPAYSTSLFYAASNNQLAILDILLKAKLHINYKTKDGSCLHAAVKAGHKDAVKRILEQDVDLDVTNASGETVEQCLAGRENMDDIMEMIADYRNRSNQDNSSIDEQESLRKDQQFLNADAIFMSQNVAANSASVFGANDPFQSSTFNPRDPFSSATNTEVSTLSHQDPFASTTVQSSNHFDNNFQINRSDSYNQSNFMLPNYEKPVTTSPEENFTNDFSSLTAVTSVGTASRYSNYDKIVLSNKKPDNFGLKVDTTDSGKGQYSKVDPISGVNISQIFKASSAAIEKDVTTKGNSNSSVSSSSHNLSHFNELRIDKVDLRDNITVASGNYDMLPPRADESDSSSSHFSNLNIGSNFSQVPKGSNGATTASKVSDSQSNNNLLIGKGQESNVGNSSSRTDATLNAVRKMTQEEKEIELLRLMSKPPPPKPPRRNMTSLKSSESNLTNQNKSNRPPQYPAPTLKPKIPSRSMEGPKITAPSTSGSWSTIQENMDNTIDFINFEIASIKNQSMNDHMKPSENIPQSVLTWLQSIGYPQYQQNFIKHGFDDIQYLGGKILTDRELLQIGIEDENHRRFLLREIDKLPVAHKLTQITKSNSLMEWLETINLESYLSRFQQHGFLTIKDVVDVNDFNLTQILDIASIGHRRRMLLSLEQFKRKPSLPDANLMH
ncbi:Ankyrin repeat and sterile alpha motif domain-containing protein 1B [Trichoplax sp. H2]|nr:Ankyrin repeat and sterile alpha motif domain-containing protein 1B [Trichoplax sp. H2]|eukprot:RDD42183.1 Ankyrin repeat and sterile alpha motif domain-containing protein 1B [Trichoplax sp. H2]